MLRKGYLLTSLTTLILSHSLQAETEVDISLGVEYGYDDNVIVEELDLQSSLGDQFTRYILKADLDHEFNKQQSISFGLSFNDRRFNDATTFDLTTLLATAGYKYDFGDLTLGFDLRTADTELGGNDFLSIDQASPYFTYFISSDHFIRGAYTTADKTLDRNPTRDSDSDEFSLDYYYFINGLNSYLIFSGRWRDQDAVDDLLDYNSSQYRAAFNQRFELFSNPVKLTLSYRTRERDYDAVINPDIGGLRLDDQTVFASELTMELTEALELSLEARNLDNDSNLPNYTFKENLYTLGLTYTF